MRSRVEELKQAAIKDAVRKVELGSAEPTYPATNSMPVDEARQVLERHLDEFIRVAGGWKRDKESPTPPPVHAIRAETGIGKTRCFAARLAAHLHGTDERPWLYLVPTHRLGDDTAERFREQGLTARVYRGRDAADPMIEGNLDLPKQKQVRMCRALEQVKLAMACGQDVNTACCKNKHQQCKFFHECGYQRQLADGEQPNVWLAAHNMLFHPQKLFSEAAGIVIDETYYGRGLRGFSKHEDEDDDEGFALAELDPIRRDFHDPEYADYHLGRDDLVHVLEEHPLGGLQRDLFKGELTPERCTIYKGQEWKFVNSVQLSPEMDEDEISRIAALAPALRRARFMAGIWHALRELLEMPQGTVSGRLVLTVNKDGKRVIKHRGVRKVIEARQVPTLILDATLPDVAILQKWHPQVQVVADIEVEMPPHVHVRQVIAAPVSQRKMWGTKKKEAVGRNRELIRRYILQRWLETDRQPMLVICQERVEGWLREVGLPEGIAIEHFNNISGIDRYKHVRSLILWGGLSRAQLAWKLLLAP
jgi:putative DNA primase/helicase